MSSEHENTAPTEPSPSREVSVRFLADFFRILDDRGIPVSQLLGDLPIGRSDDGSVVGPVDWNDFVELMKRLQLQVGGATGLERLGAAITETKPAATLRALAGISGSNRLLYKAAVRWALPRALPMVEASIDFRTDNSITIAAKTSEGLRPCPALLPLATGAIRALPGILGFADAVVETRYEGRSVLFEVALPPSTGFFAKARRVIRTVFSSGSVLQFLEQQQLELHAQHTALRRVHEELARSEARHRALTDAAVDVLLEIDDAGKIIHASASIENLIGYTREQVTGSHFALWIPEAARTRMRERFRVMCEQPPGGVRFREIVRLQGTQRREVVGELSARSYLTSEGKLRLACVLRDVSHRFLETAAAPLGADLPESRMKRGAQPILATDSTGPPDLPASPNEPADGFAFDQESLVRIVDVSVAQSERDDSRPSLIETKKLLESLRLGAEQSAEMENVELRFDAARCPSEIRAEAPILRMALESLIHFLHRSAPYAPLIEISVRRDRNPGAGAVVDFRLEARAKDEWESLGGHCEARKTPREEAGLAMAIARDAARVLSGTIVIEDMEEPKVHLRIPATQATTTGR